MTYSGISTSVRTHLADASFHAGQMRRALDSAAAQAQTKNGRRKLSRLAVVARRWALELDPKTHWRRDREAAAR